MNQTKVSLPIALTMGEPSGIGGELAFKAWEKLSQTNTVFFLIDNIQRLLKLKKILNSDIPLQEIQRPEEAKAVFSQALPVLSIDLAEEVILGQLNTKNGHAVINAIKQAVTFTQSNQAKAIVTNPIHKAALYETGFAYPGHTEFLAALAHIEHDSVMMLANDYLKVVPITIHQSLKEAITSLSEEKIIETALVVNQALKAQYKIDRPRLAFSGLNPHAGEDGKMGQEEITIIKPAIDKLRQQGIDAIGPLPGDTMFHAEARQNYDVALCMYHDQALIPVKTLDFHGGVNVTLGLPFIRTSPDHGTALDIAGKNIARPDSLINALKLADQMTQNTSSLSS